MSFNSATIKITGVQPLLQNNPQTVSRTNEYAREMRKINAKKTRRTDDDFVTLSRLEVRSKLYFSDETGVYIPNIWLNAAIAENSFRVCKVSKDTIRGSVFIMEPRAKLHYRDERKVKTPEDIVLNKDFVHTMILPQGQVRIEKAFPIFHEWSFEFGIEFDASQIDPDDLTRTIEYAAKYRGFGDFRPTFGRATAEVIHA
jgi:hypothetical protein